VRDVKSEALVGNPVTVQGSQPDLEAARQAQFVLSNFGHPIRRMPRRMLNPEGKAYSFYQQYGRTYAQINRDKRWGGCN
jgi:hypothetical protein